MERLRESLEAEGAQIIQHLQFPLFHRAQIYIIFLNFLSLIETIDYRKNKLNIAMNISIIKFYQFQIILILMSNRIVIT